MFRNNKTGINFKIFIKYSWKVVCNTMLYVHDFSVWPRTGSNPVDYNRVRSHIGKIILGKNGNRKLEYLDFTDKFPQWKQLARKAVSLDLLSGFSLVYLYPRLKILKLFFKNSQKKNPIHLMKLCTKSII